MASQSLFIRPSRQIEQNARSVHAVIKRSRLGRTGYKVSHISLGTYRCTGDFGIPRSKALDLLERAVTLGINYMDTAPLYGAGESEELIGRVLQRHPDTRVFISSKFGALYTSIVHRFGDEAYRNEDCVRRVVEHSLWLLRRDHLDMLFVHEPDAAQWDWNPKTLDAPVLRALEKLRDEKVIGAIGLGSNSVEMPGKLAETGRFDVIEIANGHTLLQQRLDDRILPAARLHDIGIVAGGPLRDGMLATTRHDKLAELRERGECAGWVTANSLNRLDRLYRLSEETEIPICELALRYIVSNPEIDTVIPGAQSVEEVEMNYQSGLKGPLPDEILEQIERIHAETRD